MVCLSFFYQKGIGIILAHFKGSRFNTGLPGAGGNIGLKNGPYGLIEKGQVKFLVL